MGKRTTARLVFIGFVYVFLIVQILCTVSCIYSYYTTNDWGLVSLWLVSLCFLPISLSLFAYEIYKAVKKTSIYVEIIGVLLLFAVNIGSLIFSIAV